MRYRLLFLVLMTMAAVQSWGEVLTINFNDKLSAYEDNWVFENITSQVRRNTPPSSIYHGTNTSNASASITTKNKIANPCAINFWMYCSSSYDSSCSWQVQVSSDGTAWTNVGNPLDTYRPVSLWYDVTKNLSSYKNVYVRIAFAGTASERYIDEVKLITQSAPPSKAITGNVFHGVVAPGDIIHATDHEGHYIDDGFDYKVISVNTDGVGEAEICGCNLTGAVTIPSSVYCSKDPICTNFKIKHLGRDLGVNITKLTFEEGIEDVAYKGSGYKTWQYGYLTYMTNLMEIVVPKTMNNIRFHEDGGMAYNLAKITIDPENPYLETVTTAENSLIVIDKAEKRIQGCTMRSQDGEFLTSLTIPEGVTGIGGNYGYRAIGGGGNDHFVRNCRIETVNIPKSFKDYYTGHSVLAFSSMRNLKVINVNEENTTFCSYQGVLYKSKITDKQWGSNLMVVPAMWNPNTDGSTDVTYSTPEGVSEIQANSLHCSRSVKHVIVNDTEAGGVTIKDRFINTSSSIKDITIPACAKFNELTYNCYSLSDINIATDTHGHTSTCTSDKGILYTADKKTAILCPSSHVFKETIDGVETGSYKAPDETTSIGNSAFYNCTNLTSLDLNNVTAIGSDAFRNTRLTSVDLKNVKTVGGAAFYYSSGTLTTVNLGRVEKLAANAFSQQPNITEITIPSSCTEIGTYCFSSAPLTKLEFEDAVPTSKEGLDNQPNLKLSGGSQFHSSMVKEIVLPSRLNIIENGTSKEAYSTFGYCEKITVGPSSRLTNFNFSTAARQDLKEVEFLPNFEGTTGTHTIADKAFAGYENLTKVTNIPINTTTLGSMSFADTPKLTTVTFAEGESQLTELKSNAFLRSAIKTFAIPNGVKTLGQRIFSESTLEEVNLPKTMTSIDPLTFDGCASLKAINVSEENTKYSSLGGMVMSKDKKKIVAFPQGKSQDGFTFLPPVVETIGQFAFFNSQNLKSVVLPRSIKKIENKAFECCYNLTDIYLMGGASTADDNFASDAAADDAKGTETEKDHRFGDPDVSARDFLKSKVTVHYLSTTSGSTTGYFTGQETKAKETAKAFSLGDGRAVGQYYITNEEGKGNTAMFVGARNEEGDATAASYSYVVPATITIKDADNNDVTYNVNRIADFAFEGQTEIPSQYKEVILRGNYDYIGAKLFGSSSSVQNVFYAPESKNVSTSLCEKTSRYEYGLTADYNSIPSNINCYVPKTEYNAWTEYTGGDTSKNTLSSNLSYKIPFPAISKRFGTMSREFDVDLQDNNGSGDVNWNSTLDKPSVIAFTGYEKTITDENNVQHIIMTSINNGAADGTDGTYIPANTGVLLRAYNGDGKNVDQKSPEGFYYRIGEKSITAPTNNVMACVTETSRTIQPTETGYTNYVISGGKYYSIADGQTVTIPAHKSYLHIPTSPGAKGIKLVFEDEGSTGIRAVDDATSVGEDVIYDLQGRRVTSPSKGLYIVNGRKVVMK